MICSKVLLLRFTPPRAPAPAHAECQDTWPGEELSSSRLPVEGGGPPPPDGADILSETGFQTHHTFCVLSVVLCSLAAHHTNQRYANHVGDI